jgi:thiol peroxidase
MSTIALKGKSVHTVGELPKVGTSAPDFLLTKADLGDVRLSDFAGNTLILNIVPSLDTGVCAASARTFNAKLKALSDVIVLTISRDLPFAQARFCQAEHIDAVVTLSELRGRDFGKDYGVEMVDGPLAGLLSRAIVVIAKDGTVRYTEQVPEITQEPDYEKALRAARKI